MEVKIFFKLSSIVFMLAYLTTERKNKQLFLCGDYEFLCTIRGISGVSGMSFSFLL